MGGKALAAVGGILSIVGVFLLTWIDNEGLPFYVYGISAISKITDFFTNAEYIMNDSLVGFNTILGTSLGTWFSYILGVLVILVLASGILSLIGIKARAFAFIGGLLTLLPGLFILLATFLNDVDFIAKAAGAIVLLFSTLDAFPIAAVAEYIPFNYAIPVGSGSITVGCIVLVLGGLLALISGFISRDEY